MLHFEIHLHQLVTSKPVHTCCPFAPDYDASPTLSRAEYALGFGQKLAGLIKHDGDLFS